MYILIYCEQDFSKTPAGWTDHFELFDRYKDAEKMALWLENEQGLEMWAISRVMLSSEPHWMEEGL